MADLPEFSPELSPEERTFLQQVRQWVKDDNQTIDFDTLRQKAPTNNKGIFWLSFACELCTLPPSGSLDIRENGRLSVALRILYALLESNSHVPQVWSCRLMGLLYLSSGLEAFANVAAITEDLREQAPAIREEAQQLKNEMYAFLDEALVRFPGDQWFINFRHDYLEDEEDNADSASSAATQN